MLHSEVNALHLYPEVRENREMDECLEVIREDRKQARELENSNTQNAEKDISTEKTSLNFHAGL